VSVLEARLTKKDEVIAEISQEYVSLKKELGEP
jgi:transposase